MNVKEALKFMSVLFCVVTTAELFFVSLLNMIFASGALFTPLEMLGLVAVALASVLPTFIYVIKIKKTRRSLILRDVVHFLLTLGTVVAALVTFGWVNTENALVTLFMFIFIYAGAHIVQEIRGRSLADKLNEKLNAIHDGDKK